MDKTLKNIYLRIDATMQTLHRKAIGELLLKIIYQQSGSISFDDICKAYQKETKGAIADRESLNNRLLIWKSKIDTVLSTEYPNYTPEVEEFNRRWRISIIGNSVRNAVIRKLRNARTDLRFIMQADEPRHSRLDRETLPEFAITEYAKSLWGI